jgi:hypothetical protein
MKDVLMYWNTLICADFRQRQQIILNKMFSQISSLTTWLTRLKELARPVLKNLPIGPYFSHVQKASMGAPLQTSGRPVPWSAGLGQLCPTKLALTLPRIAT